jgi:hypothetical protein
MKFFIDFLQEVSDILKCSDSYFLSLDNEEDECVE